MSERIGTAIGFWLYKNKVIAKDEIDTIRFSIEIGLSEFPTFMVIFRISFLTNKMIETILYIIVFQLLRNAFQGYHAKTILRCFLLTISVYFIIITLYPYVSTELLCLFLLASLIETIYNVIRKNKKVMFVLITLLLVGILCYFLNYPAYLQLFCLTSFFTHLSTLPERRNHEAQHH